MSSSQEQQQAQAQDNTNTTTNQVNVSASAAATAGVARAPQASATQTITETPTMIETELLHLTLRGRPNVTWDEEVIDNEGLGRKSSKRCCIFHKQRAFDESSTDSSDYDSDRSLSSAASDASDAKMPAKKIARPKKQSKSKIPDNQRFHA